MKIESANLTCPSDVCAHKASQAAASKSINVWSDDLMIATQRILPLSEARRAHELSQDGHVPGKIVLRVTEIQL
jgi:hypothetical protein